MKDIFTIEKINRITSIRFKKAPILDDLKRIIDLLADNYPYEKRLWDLSGIGFDLSTSDIRTIAEYGKQKFIKPSFIAMVAPDDLAFGEMRAFEVYREQHRHAVARVFRSRSEAIDWLNEQPVEDQLSEN